MILHHTDQGEGEPIVLLHGMAASGRYWDELIPHLVRSHRVIAIDLLGFGRSPMPKDVTYNYETHVASILKTLDHLRITKFTLVGHSMGALLALRLTALHEGRVRKLVLLNMPVFTSADEAKRSITKSKLSLKLAYYGPTSHALCATWCGFLRPLSSRVAPYYLKNVSRNVAHDSVLHTWQSYEQSLQNVISTQNVEKDLQKLHIPVHLIYGDQEDQRILENVFDLKDLPDTVKIEVRHGIHNFLLNNEQVISELIAA